MSIHINIKIKQYKIYLTFSKKYVYIIDKQNVKLIELFIF